MDLINKTIKDKFKYLNIDNNELMIEIHKRCKSFNMSYKIRKEIQIIRKELCVVDNSTNSPNDINFWLINGWSISESIINKEKYIKDKRSELLSKSEFIEFKTLTEFIKFIKNEIDNINYENYEYMEGFYNYITNKPYFKTELNKKIREFIINKRNGKHGSIISKDYWISLGWLESDIITIVSDKQKERSPYNIDYHTSRGISRENAIEKISDIQSKNSKMRKSVVSHFQKSYWKDKGYTEEEYFDVIKKLNPQLEEFYDNREEFMEFKSKFSNIMREVWYRELPNKKFINSQSKEEVEFFKSIKEIDSKFKHTPLYVNFIHNDNRIVYIFDGYVNTEFGKILIEYDGLYWHDYDYDLNKDTLTLEYRKDVAGVIRISDKFSKSNNTSYIVSKINNAINDILNSEVTIFRIY